MNQVLSPTTRKRLDIQGYGLYSDEELNQYKFGIRFAYLGCGSIVALGLVWQNPVIWGIAMGIAFLAILLPYHPIDYLYNYGVRFLINKPRLPKRTDQAKFACAIATVWLAMVITLFLSGHVLIANVLTGLLLLQAGVVGTIDFCVPSMIFNALNRSLIERKFIP